MGSGIGSALLRFTSAAPLATECELNRTDYAASRIPAGNSQTIFETGAELLGRLLSAGEPKKTVLIVDTCYAEGFDQCFGHSLVPPLLTIYSSAADEKAIALNSDSASRLSLALSRQLSGRTPHIDLVRVVINVAEVLDKDGLIPGQHVTYRMN